MTAKDRLPRKRVLVAVPCGDMVHAGFAYDLSRMLAYSVAMDDDLLVAPAMIRGTVLPSQRHVLVRDALEGDFTHILWLDSDMRFPKNTLLRLLAHEKSVVAVNYTTRRVPIVPLARSVEDETPMFFTEGQTGLVQAKTAGLGVCLMETAVFRNMAPPWFAIGYNREHGVYAGEDIYLFTRMHDELRVPLFIDVDLSRTISHIGEFEYTTEQAAHLRDASKET